MRKIKIIIFISFLILFLSIFPIKHQILSLPIPLRLYEEVKAYDVGKITGDGGYLVTLAGPRWKKYGKEMIIYSIEEKKEVYRKDISHLNPWKIVIGDVDGDEIDDISIGVYKESPLHPVMAKRPFIYSYNEGNLEPKWRGSRLSKPFTDYTLYDVDGDGIDEIIAIEMLKDGRKVINTYKWKGFGFEGFLQSQSFQDIMDLTKEEEKVIVKIIEEKEEFKGVLKLEDDNLIVERVD